MKRLISIISTKGKSPEQTAKEVFQAHKKYHQVKKQVESTKRILIPATRGALAKSAEAIKRDISFSEIKQDTLALIEKIRAVNPESGAHFENHIIFDDKNETMIYTDKPESVKLPLLAKNHG
jgi:hypothetical protein